MKSRIVVLLGLILIGIGVFFQCNKKRIVVCTGVNGEISLTKKFEIDRNGKALTFEQDLMVDHSEETEDEFKKFCENVDYSHINKEGTYETKTYCDLKNKKYHSVSRVYYYNLPFGARLMTFYEDYYEYINEEDILDIENWKKDLINDNYSCE